jgi:hypothetical protein
VPRWLVVSMIRKVRTIEREGSARKLTTRASVFSCSAYPAHVGLAEDELAEGNVPRFAQGDLGLRLGHGRFSATGRPGASLSAPQPVTGVRASLSLREPLREMLLARQWICAHTNSTRASTLTLGSSINE